MPQTRRNGNAPQGGCLAQPDGRPLQRGAATKTKLRSSECYQHDPLYYARHIVEPGRRPTPMADHGPSRLDVIKQSKDAVAIGSPQNARHSVDPTQREQIHEETPATSWIRGVPYEGYQQVMPVGQRGRPRPGVHQARSEPREVA
jgi:hypothetical protein